MFHPKSRCAYVEVEKSALEYSRVLFFIVSSNNSCLNAICIPYALTLF